MIDQYGRYVPDYFSQTPMRPLQKYEVIRVNGKNGADMFQMAPNCEALLLDTTAPIVWLKTTDGAGYPTCTPYSITPYQAQAQPTVTDLLSRIERLEGIINESHVSESKKSADY